MHDLLIGRLEHAGLLSEPERQALHALTLRPRAVVARTDIDAGGEPHSVQLILSGIACRYKIWSGGARRIISLILPGDLCDGHLPIPYTLGNMVGALTPCTVADIPRRAMADLIETYPQIARTLWWMTLVKLNVAQEWLASTSRDADKQLAHVFCELLVRLQARGLADENSFEFGLSQPDLADVIGISLVHINRVVQSLRSSGLIVWSHRRLTVPDVAQLKAFAEFDPGYLRFGEGQRSGTLPER